MITKANTQRESRADDTVPSDPWNICVPPPTGALPNLDALQARIKRRRRIKRWSHITTAIVLLVAGGLTCFTLVNGDSQDPTTVAQHHATFNTNPITASHRGTDSLLDPLPESASAASTQSRDSIQLLATYKTMSPVFTLIETPEGNLYECIGYVEERETIPYDFDSVPQETRQTILQSIVSKTSNHINHL
ncbi:MAG: hypothetical protein AAFN70_12530 [Planctomycetota bacterium]